MHPLHIETPLIQSNVSTSHASKTIYYKLESLQPCGSFKLRGIGRLCQKASHEGAHAFVASSGGNAGAAVAYCGMKLDIPTTIFIPTTSHQLYVDKIRSFGATVIVAGSTAGDTQEAATIFAKENNATYIHPYDHPEIWTGHASIIDEVVQHNIRPDVIIVSVGGGGLACGILEGMHKHGWNDIPLIAVETIGADVFSQSVQAQKPIHLTKITSQATSLGATYVAPRLLEWTTQHPIKNVVISDEDALFGSRALAANERLLVELASGASLSLVFNNHPAIRTYQSILVIVCGGLNISHFTL